MSRYVTVATFVTGMVVGAGLVYLTPPAGPTMGPPGGPMGGGGPPGSGPPQGAPMGPGGGPPGMTGGGPPGATGGGPPGEAGTGSAPPGNPGEVPPGAPAADGSAAVAGDPAGAHPAGVPADAGPRPPVGAGTPGGAEGPALPAGDPRDLAGAAPVERPGAGVDWLGKHLDGARAYWTSQAEAAERSADVRVKALGPEMRAMVALVPIAGDRAPPLQEVVILLAEERRMYERMKAAGMDTARIESEIRVVLRAPPAQALAPKP